MADLPAGAHPCPGCGRPVWHEVERCGALEPVPDWARRSELIRNVRPGGRHPDPAPDLKEQ